jgi:hypothetical protein
MKSTSTLNHNFLNIFAITLSFTSGIHLSVIAIPSFSLQPEPRQKLTVPYLEEICRSYEPETAQPHQTEALAWLESQTSPLTLAIVSALWFGRNPHELEKLEMPISVIEACLVYPNALSLEIDTTLDHRTAALTYWQSIIPEPVFLQFYQRWQTP